MTNASSTPHSSDVSRALPMNKSRIGVTISWADLSCSQLSEAIIDEVGISGAMSHELLFSIMMLAGWDGLSTTRQRIIPNSKRNSRVMHSAQRQIQSPESIVHYSSWYDGVAVYLNGGGL